MAARFAVHYVPPHYVHDLPFCGSNTIMGDLERNVSAVTCKRCLDKIRRAGPVEALTVERDRWKAVAASLQRDANIATDLFGKVNDAAQDARAVGLLKVEIGELRNTLTALGAQAAILAETADLVRSRLSSLEDTADRLAARPVMLQVPGYVSRAVAENMIPGELAALAAQLHRIPIGPETPARGIYFLLSGVRVVYVGQSVSVLGRLGQHLRDKDFDSVVALPVGPDQSLDAIEGAFIRWLRPTLNAAGRGPLTDEDRTVLAALGMDVP